MNRVLFYRVDNSQIIAVKKIVICGKSNIIFIDKETDGLEFSYTITDNFSIKNINKFLTSKFKTVRPLNNKL